MEGKMKVNIEDIIHQIEFTPEENNAYLNKSTGKILIVPEDLLFFLNGDEDEEDLDLPEWEEEMLPEVRDLRDNPENFIPFPEKFDLDQYGMMENFIGSLRDAKVRDSLYSEIKGQKAFERFQKKIEKYDLEND